MTKPTNVSNISSEDLGANTTCAEASGGGTSIKDTSSELDTTRLSIRHEMPIAKNWAYFDHASVAPISGPAHAAIQRWIDDSAFNGDTNWLAWNKTVEATRQSAAKLINASPDEIALVNSTTAGINLVANGLDWQEGDNVVVLADEFPSNLYPWMNLKSQGVETRLVGTEQGRLCLDRLREACDDHTRLVSTSWVGYTTGYRQDIDAIAEIAHAAGGKQSSHAYFLLDAIQGLGVLPIDVEQTAIDFLAADGHKWLLGPEGAGIAYIRNENLEALRPHNLGWHSVENSHNFALQNLELLPTAARFEGGSANMPGMHGLGASLDFLQQHPIQAIEATLLDVTDYLCLRMTESGGTVISHRNQEPQGHDPRSGIVAVMPPHDENPEVVRLRCLDAGIVARCRGNWIRFSPHAYTTYDEVDQLMDAVLK